GRATRSRRARHSARIHRAAPPRRLAADLPAGVLDVGLPDHAGRRAAGGGVLPLLQPLARPAEELRAGVRPAAGRLREGSSRLPPDDRRSMSVQVSQASIASAVTTAPPISGIPGS